MDYGCEEANERNGNGSPGDGLDHTKEESGFLNRTLIFVSFPNRLQVYKAASPKLRRSLLHIRYLLDKQNKPLEGVERDGCDQCL
jgi:hypothetical protein